MEGYCPPHVADMRADVDALCERKFGAAGPFNVATPGPWKDSARVRSDAQVHSEELRACVALQAQYILDTFGNFPGTVPSMIAVTHLQAHHLDVGSYDRFYEASTYLDTYADHMRRWHGETTPETWG